MTKDFKYTVKSKCGKIILETVVAFGNEEHPFPEDWRESPLTQMSIMDYKHTVIEDNFDVEVSEDTTLTLKNKK